MFYQYTLWTFSQDPRLTTVPAFNLQAAAQQTALEFLTGYLVEKSLKEAEGRKNGLARRCARCASRDGLS